MCKYSSARNLLRGSMFFSLVNKRICPFRKHERGDSKSNCNIILNSSLKGTRSLFYSQYFQRDKTQFGYFCLLINKMPLSSIRQCQWQSTIVNNQFALSVKQIITKHTIPMLEFSILSWAKIEKKKYFLLHKELKNNKIEMRVSFQANIKDSFLSFPKTRGNYLSIAYTVSNDFF